MRSFRAILLFLIVGAANAEVRVDAYAEPDGEVYLGQRVRLIVEVSTDTWFTKAPRYPELKFNGTIALLPEGFGVNFTKREGGQTWAGQRQRYVLFPQRVGTLTVPGIDVPLAVSVDGKAGDIQVVTTPPVNITVVSPPGSADVDSFVTTPRLSVTDDWDRDLEGLKVGDAITRTITQHGDDVFALVLPTIEFTEIDGFGVYPATPELKDRAQRGSYSATRTDRVTYVLQAEGDFRIPAVDVHWFSLRDRRMVTETLDAVELNVLPNPEAMLGNIASGPDAQAFDVDEALRNALDWLGRNIHWLTLLAGGLFAARWLWRRFVPGWRKSLRDTRERRRHSEARYFADLLRAMRSGDSDRIVSSFWQWADRLPGRSAPLTLATLVDESGSQELASALREFEVRRYGHREDGAGSKIRASDLKKLRHSWLRRQHRPASREQGADRLNP